MRAGLDDRPRPMRDPGVPARWIPKRPIRSDGLSHPVRLSMWWTTQPERARPTGLAVPAGPDLHQPARGCIGSPAVMQGAGVGSRSGCIPATHTARSAWPARFRYFRVRGVRALRTGSSSGPERARNRHGRQASQAVRTIPARCKVQQMARTSSTATALRGRTAGVGAGGRAAEQHQRSMITASAGKIEIPRLRRLQSNVSAPSEQRWHRTETYRLTRPPRSAARGLTSAAHMIS